MDFDVSRLPELPFMALFDIAGSGNVRYFWLYIVTGLAIGYLAHRFSGDKRTFGEVLFARNVWLSRSALNDYGIIIINPVIRFLCITWLVTNLQAIVATGGALIRGAGVSGTVNDGTALALGLLLTLVIFIVSDFLRFFLHYLEHRLPILWEFHKVHHSAEVLNFATADRIHPMELLFSGIGMAIGMGLVNGAFIAVWGDQLTVATVAGDGGDGELVAPDGNKGAVDQAHADRHADAGKQQFHRVNAVGGGEIEHLGGMVNLVELPQYRQPVLQVMQKEAQKIADDENHQRQKQAKRQRSAVIDRPGDTGAADQGAARGDNRLQIGDQPGDA